MITFRVEDMRCGGCVRAIRAAVAAVAPRAVVEADVGARTVSVEGAGDAVSIERAIVGAGFSAIPEPQADGDAGASRQAATGGCCAAR